MSLALAQPQPEAIAAACRHRQVAHMHAFGSVARSDYRPGKSDIDLLVEFQPCEPGTLYRSCFNPGCGTGQGVRLHRIEDADAALGCARVIGARQAR